MNSRGQALIEGVIAIPLLFAGFAFILSLSYFGFASTWIGYQMDQSLFCLAEGQPENRCTSQFRTQIRSGLPFGQITNLKLEELKRDFWQARVEWIWMKQRISRKKLLKWDSLTWRS
jgi:hypothetical protein